LDLLVYKKNITNISNSINRLSTGVVTTYALYILVGIIFYISILYLTSNNEDSLLLIIVIFIVFFNAIEFSIKKSYNSVIKT